MDKKTFLENFEVFADAPNGVQQLRKLIYDLAVEGQLINLNNVASESNSAETFQKRRIKNFVTLFNGNSTSASEKNRLARNQSGIPYIATKDIEYGFQPVDYQTGLYVEEEDTKYKIAPKGAVLICLEGGSAGRKMALIERDVAFGNKLFANVCNKDLNPKFLLISFLSTSFQSQFKSGMSGIIGGISKVRFAEIEISVPSIEHQEIIVSKVDELMALCDELEAEKGKQEALRSAARDSAIEAISTATTPEELSTAWSRISNNWELMSDSVPDVDRLRKLIYQVAFDGFTSQHVDNSNNLLNNWRNSTIGEILSLEYGKPLDKSLRRETGKFPVYGANGIKCYTDDAYVVEPGIVVGRKGSAGEVNMTSSPFWPLDVTFFVAHDSKETDLVFLFHLLKHLDLTALAHGIKPGINRNEVYRIPVSVPSIHEQLTIVSQIEALLELCNQLVEGLEVRTNVETDFAKAASRLVTA